MGRTATNHEVWLFLSGQFRRLGWLRWWRLSQQSPQRAVNALCFDGHAKIIRLGKGTHNRDEATPLVVNILVRSKGPTTKRRSTEETKETTTRE